LEREQPPRPPTPPAGLRPDDGIFRRLSVEFINAQNAVEGTKQQLRARLRSMRDRIDRHLQLLEAEGVPDPGQVGTLHEEGAAVDRMSRVLAEQHNMLEDALGTVSRVAGRKC